MTEEEEKGARLYDDTEAAKVVDAKFDNPTVQTLFDTFNNAGTKLLALYEKREFLTYFFLGSHSVPALTPQQAWDFKTKFEMHDFPANGIKEYNNWLRENGNNYEYAFPYPVTKGNGDIKEDKWKIGHVEDIFKSISNYVTYQANFGNWLTDVHSGSGSWESAIDKLISPKNDVDDFFAKLAGLFATGKFVKYYNTVVKRAIDSVVNHVTFDPYTGTIEAPGYEKPVRFSQLIYLNDEYAKKLMKSSHIDDTTLPYEHRFFCILCDRLANCFDPYYVLDGIAPEIKKEIKTFWDFTPSYNKGGKLPYDPEIDSQKWLINSGLITCIMYSGRKFIEEILYLDDGNTSYKDLWEGAKFKSSSGGLKNCPFYFVIHVNFDSTIPEDNPFTSEALTEINKEIQETIEKRAAAFKELENIFVNVSNLQTCSASVTNLGTYIWEDGATGNKQIINPTCTFNSKTNEVSKENNTTSTKERDVDKTQTYTEFEFNNLVDHNKPKPEEPEEDIAPDYDKKEQPVETETGNRLVIIIAAIAAVVVIFGIGIWIYKRGKNSGIKSVVSAANP